MMSQSMTQQEIRYDKYEPAPSSRVLEREMDIREILDDLQMVLQVGAAILIDKRGPIPFFSPKFDQSTVMPRVGAEGENASTKEAFYEAFSVDKAITTLGSHIMEEAVDEIHPVPLRISKIVDKLIEEDEVLRSVDKTQVMKSLSELMEDPPSDLTSITDDELAQRIERVLLIEAMSGILNDLSPAQIRAFDAAVKRRKFF